MTETLTTFCWNWAAFMAGQLTIIAAAWIWLGVRKWQRGRRKSRSVARAGDPSWRYRQTSRTRSASED